MIRICAECRRVIGEKEPLDDKSITHGLCASCLNEQLEQVKRINYPALLHHLGRMAGEENGEGGEEIMARYLLCSTCRTRYREAGESKSQGQECHEAEAPAARPVRAEEVPCHP